MEKNWLPLLVFLILLSITRSANVNRSEIIRHRGRSSTTTTTTVAPVETTKAPRQWRRPQRNTSTTSTTSTTPTTTTTTTTTSTTTETPKRRLIPKKNNTSVYDFTTGKIEKPVQDLNISTSAVKEVKVLPERFSAKYNKLDRPIVVANLNETQDSASAGTHEEAKKEEDKNTKFEKGKGEENHSEKHAIHGEKGDKEYKGEHHHEKGSKGSHDKEGHAGEYHDEKGTKKDHKEGGGHFEAGEHGEKGEKELEHDDKEEYKKGHSTRGGHVVHKKDEYEKKQEFWDEHHEGGDGEKFGSFYEEYGGKKGGHKKGGHKNGKFAHDQQGKKGHFEKGKSFKEDKGHDKKGGKEGHYGHMEKYGKKSAHDNFKKYSFDSKPDGGDKDKKASNIVYHAVPLEPQSESRLTYAPQMPYKKQIFFSKLSNYNNKPYEEPIKPPPFSYISKYQELPNKREVDFLGHAERRQDVNTKDESCSEEEVVEDESKTKDLYSHLKEIKEDVQSDLDSNEEESQVIPKKVEFHESSLEDLWRDFLNEAFEATGEKYSPI